MAALRRFTSAESGPNEGRHDQMTGFKRFATERPILFSILITISVLGFYILAGMLAAILAEDDVSGNIIEAIGRLIGSLVFLCIIWRLSWQEATGIRRLGSLIAWIVAGLILLYEVITQLVPYLDNVAFRTISPAETAPAALNALMTGPLEEIPFRGLILYAFLRLWADSKQGIWQSVLLSSLLFGFSHLIHIILGRPAPQAILVALNAFLAGIYYAAIVLRWRTIWTVVVLHSLLNVAATIVAYHVPGFEEEVSALLLAIVFQVPLVILGAGLISRIKPRSIVPDTV